MTTDEDTTNTVIRVVGALIGDIDDVRDADAERRTNAVDKLDVDVTALERQADLFEQAHEVLTGALEQVDRV